VRNSRLKARLKAGSDSYLASAAICATLRLGANTNEQHDDAAKGLRAHGLRLLPRLIQRRDLRAAVEVLCDHVYIL
jgi:hypothetical protein